MSANHTEDLRNVTVGDEVLLRTTANTEKNQTLRCECTDYENRQAAEFTGEVRETKIWVFEELRSSREFAVSIIDGLRGSPDDPDFPQHQPLVEQEDFKEVGYIEHLRIQ